MKRLLSLILFVALVAACSTAEPTAVAVEPTQTPDATHSPVPEATQTAEPTPTPEPTITSPPHTPTISPVPIQYPYPRLRPGMSYDIESDLIVLFGGSKGGYAGGTLTNETWVFNPSSSIWSKLTPEISPPKGDSIMAYDTESDRMIVFFGALTESGEYLDLESASETWAYDYNTNTWTNLESAEAPSGITAPRMVYDNESDRMILFGGWPTVGGPEGSSETWAYDYNSNTWEKMEPVFNPPGRFYHAMAYDAGADRVILWGGHGPIPVDVSQVWAYDYNTDTWEALESSGAPQRGKFADMVYDFTGNRNLLYVDKELWGFDYASNRWTLISDSPAPGEASEHRMAYIDKLDMVVLLNNRTWILDPSTDTWTDVTRR